MLTALTVAAVVCIASSNGGTTSQDLKTGYLVGATPSKQQWAILIGAVTSALVIGFTMLKLNEANAHYTKQGFSSSAVLAVPDDAPAEQPGRPYDVTQEPAGDNPGWEADTREYRVVHVRAEESEKAGVPAGRYLVDAEGHPRYRTDLPINRQARTMDNGQDAPKGFTAPQPALFANIIEGILGGRLQWGLIITGVMIAVALELAGVSALPVAVGMYLSLGSTTPIFLGGMVRLVADRMRGGAKEGAESETSPGVLRASGYIAGGTLCGLIVAFFAFLPDAFGEAINLGLHLFGTPDASGQTKWNADKSVGANIAAVAVFGLLAAYLLYIGSRKDEPAIRETPKM
jgi:hypothetical protein